jgi:hypothetical protein
MGEGVLGGLDRSGDGSARVLADLGEPRSIGVEVTASLKGTHQRFDVG